MASGTPNKPPVLKATSPLLLGVTNPQLFCLLFRNPVLISKPVTGHRSSSAIPRLHAHARNLNLALLQLYVARSPHSRIELQQRDFSACLRQRRLAILH
jgi:hypothetical protein